MERGRPNSNGRKIKNSNSPRNVKDKGQTVEGTEVRSVDTQED